MTKRQRTVKRGSISIRGDLYQRLADRIGKDKPGRRGGISPTVERLVNEWLDKQQQEGN